MTIRITVSLPDEVVQQAQSAIAEGQAASMSAYVAEALSRRQHKDSLRAFLDDWIAESGPPSADDEAWAERELARVEAEWAARER